MNKKITLLVCGLATVATAASMLALTGAKDAFTKVTANDSYTLTISKDTLTKSGYDYCVYTSSGNEIKFSRSNYSVIENGLGEFRGNGAAIYVNHTISHIDSVAVNYTVNGDFNALIDITFSRNDQDFNAGRIAKIEHIESGVTYTTDGIEGLDDAYLMFWYKSSPLAENNTITVESIVIKYSC